MGMQVNTNLAANNAYRNLNNTQNALSKSMEKLSSGLRINRAADDAAGLAISEGLKSQVNGYGVAARNAQDGISVIQTAEGALTEVHSILQRMRDLAVQAGNDSNNADSRGAITKEATQLTQELDRIGQATNFNGINLLDGSAGAGKDGKLSFQVGAGSGTSSTLGVDLSQANVSSIAKQLDSGALGAKGSEFAVTYTGVGAADGSAVTFTSKTAAGVTTAVTTGPLVKADGVTPQTTFTSVEDYADALKRDGNFSANFDVAVTRDLNGAGTGINVTAKDGGQVQTLTAPGTGLAAGGTQGTAPVPGGLDFSSATGAQAAIKAIDAQITAVSAVRADIGAVQNRFESAINSLNVGKENLTAASSRITDVDMASEMVSFTRSNILSQAGTAMLAQANQSNQGVLKLLG